MKSYVFGTDGDDPTTPGCDFLHAKSDCSDPYSSVGGDFCDDEQTLIERIAPTGCNDTSVMNSPIKFYNCNEVCGPLGGRCITYPGFCGVFAPDQPERFEASAVCSCNF